MPYPCINPTVALPLYICLTTEMRLKLVEAVMSLESSPFKEDIKNSTSEKCSIFVMNRTQKEIAIT